VLRVSGESRSLRGLIGSGCLLVTKRAGSYIVTQHGYRPCDISQAGAEPQFHEFSRFSFRASRPDEQGVARRLDGSVRIRYTGCSEPDALEIDAFTGRSAILAPEPLT
jgi:hypothetical protein